MKKTRFGAMLVAAAVLATGATSAFALDTNRTSRTNGRTATDVRMNDAEKDAKHAFRARIGAKNREYKSLKKADDPRAEQARLELRAMKDEWRRLYGDDELRDGKGKGKHKNKGARGNSGKHKHDRN